MATTIKIKHKDSDTAPASLRKGELAYAIALGANSATNANGADKLVIGTGTEDANGLTGQLAVIGGKYFTDMMDHVRGTLTASSAIITNASSEIDQLKVDNFVFDGHTLSIENSSATGYTDQDLWITTLRNGVIRYVPDTLGNQPTSSYSARLRTLDDDNAIPNKLYVDEEVASIVSGSTTLRINVFDDPSEVASGPIVGQRGGISLGSEFLNLVAGTGLNVTIDDPEFGTLNDADVTLTLDADIATDTTVGVASFAATNFAVSVGGEVTANDITLGSTVFTIGDTVQDVAGLNSIQVGDIKIGSNNTISNENALGGNIVLTPDAVGGTGGVVKIGTLDITKTNTILATNNNGSINIQPKGNGVVSVANDAALASKITNVADPTDPTDAANKRYVDEVAQGLTIRPAARAATTGNLDAAYGIGTNGVGATLTANNNETLPLIDDVGDGTASPGGLVTQTDRPWAVGDLILVRMQSSKAENGLYEVTDVGSAGTPWVLTRHEYMDQKEEIPSSYVFVQEGTTLAGTGWAALVEDFNDFTVGVDDIVWYQFSGAGSVSAGNGITVAGTTVSVRLDATDAGGLQFDAQGDLVIGTVPVKNGGTGRNAVPKNALVYGNDIAANDGLGAMGATKSPGDNTSGTGDWNSSNQIPTFDGTLIRWTTTIDGGTWA